MSILVTGGTGFIGKALVTKLLALGYSVTVLTRRYDYMLDVNVKIIQGDLLNPSSLPKDLFCDINVVFHCAGEVACSDNMFQLHVYGTAVLLDLVSENLCSPFPIRWIQLSSVGAYGSVFDAGKERVVLEISDEDPSGEYEITKTMADNLLRKANSSGIIALTILRPANVYGPCMPNQSLPNLLKAVKRGLFFYIGNRNAICNYVHVNDVVRALIACTNPVAVGKTYNLSNDCLMSELINYAADYFGRKRPCFVAPVSVIRLLASLFDRCLLWPLTHSRIDAMISQTRYPSGLIMEDLDFEFSFSVPESAIELIDEF